MDTKKLIGSAVGLVATGVLLYAGYYIATTYIFKKKGAEGMSNAVGTTCPAGFRMSGGKCVQNVGGDHYRKTGKCGAGYIAVGANCVSAIRQTADLAPNF